MKKVCLLFLATMFMGINSFASSASVMVSGQVVDQCTVSVNSAPSSNDVGIVLAHIDANSSLDYGMTIECNQAGLDIMAFASYGNLNASLGTGNISYSVELTGSNIASEGLKSGTSLVGGAKIGTTMAGTSSSTMLKVKPVNPGHAVYPTTYTEYITISVTSL